MKDTTLLKVLISFYNAERHIVSCIKDFKTQINADFRYIFVNNGSSDKSYENKSFHAFGQLIFPNKKISFNGTARTLTNGAASTRIGRFSYL